MRPKDTILVSGASGIIGYGILKSLRKSHPHLRLIGTSIYEDSVAPAFCDIFEKAPLTNDDAYLPWLLALIKKYDVAMAIPSIEDDVLLWSRNREQIQETGTSVLLNNPELIELCCDKWLFYEKMRDSDSPYAIPTSLEYIESEHTFPFLVKPRCGSASRGIQIIKDSNMLLSCLDDIGRKLIVQPVVGTLNEEYTVSAFFDASSHLCCWLSLKRFLSKSGFTEKAQTIELENIQHVLEELGQQFKPVGPTNFQFRKSGDHLKLLEINPRISSATSIRTAFGYNESAMSLNYFLYNERQTQPPLIKGQAVRYTEDMIFYDSSYI